VFKVLCFEFTRNVLKVYSRMGDGVQWNFDGFDTYIIYLCS
jgi:hypothetical protein